MGFGLQSIGAFGCSEINRAWELLVNKEKESVFLRINKGKHFPALTFHFFVDWN
jgi:hypothetical protein